jgi:hypothetical protein
VFQGVRNASGLIEGCFKPHKFVRAVGHNSAGKHCVFRGGNDYPEILLHEAALELVEIGNIGQALEPGGGGLI